MPRQLQPRPTPSQAGRKPAQHHVSNLSVRIANFTAYAGRRDAYRAEAVAATRNTVNFASRPVSRVLSEAEASFYPWTVIRLGCDLRHTSSNQPE